MFLNTFISRVKGFSLIELMVVIAIVALLSAVAVPAYKNYLNRAKISGAMSVLPGLGENIKIYYNKNGNWNHVANDIIPGSNTGGNADLMDNPKTLSPYFSSVNFATANLACPNAPGGTLFVSQLIATLDSSEFPSGYITSNSVVALVHGAVADGTIVSAVYVSLNSGTDVNYTGFGSPYISGGGAVTFMTAVCSTY